MKIKLLVLLLSFAVICISFGSNNSGDNLRTADTLNKMAVPDYKMMITAKLSVKPDKIKDFITAAKEIIEKSHKEAGCIFYQLYQDPYDNSKFIFVEEYKNQAAVDAHFATDYFNAFGPKISDLVAAPADIRIISVAQEVKK